MNKKVNAAALTLEKRQFSSDKSNARACIITKIRI
nr:MAG TPA: hypothetical protein [Caudoviricetes sp.]